VDEVSEGHDMREVVLSLVPCQEYTDIASHWLDWLRHKFSVPWIHVYSYVYPDVVTSLVDKFRPRFVVFAGHGKDGMLLDSDMRPTISGEEFGDCDVYILSCESYDVGKRVEKNGGRAVCYDGKPFIWVNTPFLFNNENMVLYKPRTTLIVHYISTFDIVGSYNAMLDEMRKIVEEIPGDVIKSIMYYESKIVRLCGG